MIKLKKMILKNYRGYKNFELDLASEEGVKRWSIFCGPNGIGKSNFIRAVEILTHPNQMKGRNPSRLLRNLKYNKDYVSQFRNISKDVTDLWMEGIFVDENGKEKRVVIEDTYKGILGSNLILETLSKEERELVEWDAKYARSGIVVDELSSGNEISFSIFIDADHPNNMSKFQLYRELKNPFLDFAKSVYGFNCYLPDDSIQVDMGYEYYTDFVLMKPGDTSVHYKSFSDGEKKIATLIDSLFKKCYKESHNCGDERIILVDNIEMHIYWKRHMLLMKKMEEFFPDHQMICTTHSPVIITQMNKEYVHDLEQYLMR